MSRPTARLRAWATAAAALGLSTLAGPATATAAVVLNEVAPLILRDDEPTLLDEDGASHGFVELANTGEAGVDLSGWVLRADGGAGGSWALPAITLPADGTLHFWTSAKNRNDPAQPLHASFTLAGAAEIELLDDQSTLIDAVPIAVPIDQSYGRCGASWYYFTLPTPGSENLFQVQAPLVMLPDRLSLTASRAHQLVALPQTDPVFDSQAAQLSVTPGGELLAPTDPLPGAADAIVEASSVAGQTTAQVDVTIVDWTANVSRLELMTTPDADAILGADDLGVYFARDGQLRRSADGLVTSVSIAPLPAGPSDAAALRETPGGWIYRSDHQFGGNGAMGSGSTQGNLAMQARGGIQQGVGIAAPGGTGYGDVGYVAMDLMGSAGMHGGNNNFMGGHQSPHPNGCWDGGSENISPSRSNQKYHRRSKQGKGSSYRRN